MKPQLVVLFLTVTILIIATPVSSAATTGHNITSILDNHPDFSTFNYYLTATNLSSEINSRQNITVLAIDNAAMVSFIHDKRLSDSTLKNVLSLHVLVDYFDVRKLTQIPNGTTLVSSMSQPTGAVNITILKGGRVGFAAEKNDGPQSFYVKSVEENPNDISIIQISQPLSSTGAGAEAPTASQSQIDVISIMSTHGCKAFADLLRVSEALSTFTDKFNSGLTVFCPTDNAVNDFIPKYKNLTEAKKVSLLLYHGVSVYESLDQLTDGVVNTLATEGDNKYDFTVQNDGDYVKLETKVNTANIVRTLMDQDPFVVYMISNVLMPRELFEGVVEGETAPTESPKPAKKKKKGEVAADSPADSEVVFQDVADGPGPGSDSEADDQGDDDDDDVNDVDNEVSGLKLNNGNRFIMVFFSLVIGVLVM